VALFSVPSKYQGPVKHVIMQFRITTLLFATAVPFIVAQRAHAVVVVPEYDRTFSNS